MAVRLLMTWDVVSGREQEYFEFFVREFMPGMQRLELEPSDAWFTVYGSRPQIMTMAEMPNLAAVESILHSEEWNTLLGRLMDYVENYHYKLIQARGSFQL